MSDYKTRMQEELDQLNERLEKLTAFLGSNIYSKLRLTDQLLLKEQAEIMQRYSTVLSRRIERAN